jgi:anti-sigma factor RsiW
MGAVMGETDCNHIQPMLPAYAFGTLGSDERAEVDRHLATCPVCRAELATYLMVVDSLGAAAPRETPPPALKARVFAAATGQAIPEGIVAPPRANEPALTPAGSAGRSNRLIFLLSAASILLLVGVAVLAVLLERANDDRDQAVAAREQLASYFSAGGQAVAMTSLEAARWDSWEGHGTLLSAPGKPTVVVVAGCPPSTDERVYRVWVALGDDRTGVGEITVDDNGYGWMAVEAPKALDNYDQLGVTVVTNGDKREDMMVTAL